MTRQEKADRVGVILDQKFPMPDVPLEHVDPYTLLIAVVLSAQCTDERVNRTTPQLFAKASDPAAMTRLSVPAIREIIKPCGLSPAKSKNIHALSKQLVERHGGQVPKSFEELEALPGVGHKTASVVMAHAFGVPAFPVDTHIHRLAARWGLSSGRNVEQTERDLKALYPESEWTRRHLQIIYFGRQYCPARSHDFAKCPICSWAASRARATREKQRAAGHRKRG
ncbi:MAG TPA: endonuclease III [Myxococcota bacterium]|nr:endonuclease III [Myxococcota bacterium]